MMGAATRLALHIQSVEVRTHVELASQLDAIGWDGTQAILTTGDALVTCERLTLMLKTDATSPRRRGYDRRRNVSPALVLVARRPLAGLRYILRARTMIGRITSAQFDPLHIRGERRPSICLRTIASSEWAIAQTGNQRAPHNWCPMRSRSRCRASRSRRDPSLSRSFSSPSRIPRACRKCDRARCSSAKGQQFH